MSLIWCAVFCLAGVFLHGCGGGGGTTTTTTPKPSRPMLPAAMIGGYTNQASTDTIRDAVQKGVNVLFWSFMVLKNNTIENGTLQGGVSITDVADVYNALEKIGKHDVLHFVSLGGWGPPHSLAGTCGQSPCSGEKYAAAFRSWNQGFKQAIPGFPGFAGIDWDIEGVNERGSVDNYISMEAYNVMLNMSKALRDDFLISMVPPQSYFDCTKSGFDTALTHSTPQAPQSVNFTFAGLNAYTALYAKCPECWDLVMVQLYESYSVAGFELWWDGNASNVGQPNWPRNATDEEYVAVLSNNMQCLVKGWQVDFNEFWGLQNQTLTVPSEKVVMGLGNTWMVEQGKKHPYKYPFFNGTQGGLAWCEGVTSGSRHQRTRGFAFWDIADDNSNASFVENMHITMHSCNSAGGSSYI